MLASRRGWTLELSPSRGDSERSGSILSSVCSSHRVSLSFQSVPHLLCHSLHAHYADDSAVSLQHSAQPTNVVAPSLFLSLFDSLSLSARDRSLRPWIVHAPRSAIPSITVLLVGAPPRTTIYRDPLSAPRRIFDAAEGPPPQSTELVIDL